MATPATGHAATTARGRLAPGVAGKALLARFQKLLRPAVIQTLGNALMAAQGGDTLFAAQPRHHDPDLLLGRILLARLAANIPNSSLRRGVLAHRFLSHLRSLR